uniref:Uncharacterized protein n=1 Tax=viral metagenome TaxID=1070528 RepID=A0A6C0K0A0_9ZZZZ
MSEDQDQEPMMPFEPVNPNIPICKDVHPSFCQGVFEIKQRVYNDIIYAKKATSAEAQDITLVNTYEEIIKLLHPLFMSVLTGIQVPIPDIEEITAPTRVAIENLYNQCIQEKQNNTSKSLELYRGLIQNMFHNYLYDMGSE